MSVSTSVNILTITIITLYITHYERFNYGRDSFLEWFSYILKRQFYRLSARNKKSQTEAAQEEIRQLIKLRDANKEQSNV